MTMMKKAIVYALALCGSAFTACSSIQQSSVGKELSPALDTLALTELLTEELRGEDFVWQVQQMGAKDLKDIKAKPSMSFRPEERAVAGNAGCNRYFGSFSSDGKGGIKFSKMGATMMLCPDMHVEREFLQILDRVHSYTLETKQEKPWLVFRDSTEQVLLRLEGKQPMLRIVEQSSAWQLTSLKGVSSDKHQRISLDLNPVEGRVSGHAPCNRYFGKVQIDVKGAIVFSAIASTRMACPDLELEYAYIRALEEVKRYRITEGRDGESILQLLDASGSTLLSYRPKLK